MRNSIHSISEVFGGISTSIDLEDNSSDLMVLQKSDMTIAYTSQIAMRYQANEPYWVIKTLGYNIKDEVIYIVTDPPTIIAPDFIPEEVI